MRGGRMGGAHREQERCGQPAAVRDGRTRKPDRHLQRASALRSRDGAERAGRGRRARRRGHDRLDRGLRRPDRPDRLLGLEGRHRGTDPARSARSRRHRHPRLHDRAGYVRHAPARRAARGGARRARQAGAVPEAPGAARGVRGARLPHRREPDAERRDDPPRRRAQNAAPIARERPGVRAIARNAGRSVVLRSGTRVFLARFLPRPSGESIHMPEAVIVDAVRTPIGRAFKGSLTQVRPDDMGAYIVDQLLARNEGLDPASVDDLICGCGMTQGEQAYNIGRIVVLLSEKLPDSVTGSTIARYCASSLNAIRIAADSVRAGDGDTYIAAGVESVSRAGPNSEATLPDTQNPKLQGKENTHNAYIAMGETAENVAERYGVKREDMDEFAKRSQDLAVESRDGGFFDREIVAVETPDHRSE